MINTRDYKEEISHRFATAWELVQSQVEKAQGCQKFFHDKAAKQPDIKVGFRVFVFHPAKRKGKAYKFSRPFVGPYCLLTLHPNGAKVKLTDKPSSQSIWVAPNQIRLCPKEIPDQAGTAEISNDANDQLIEDAVAISQPQSESTTDNEHTTPSVTKTDQASTVTKSTSASEVWSRRLCSSKKS